MATKEKSTPSVFSFLKEGLLLLNRNRGLFAAVGVLIVAYTSLLLLTNDLAIQPLSNEILLDVKALNGTDPGSPGYSDLLNEMVHDSQKLMLVTAAYFLFALVVGSAVRIVVLFAAVATYSGEQHTFGSILGRAMVQLKGPVLTVAFVYVLQIAYGALLAVAVLLEVFFVVKGYDLMLILIWPLLVLAAVVVSIYFSVVCSLGVVVAVAEPGCHGAAALGRAWRLAKGKKWQIVILVVVTALLAGVLFPVYRMAKTSALNSMAVGLFLGFVYVILMAVVQVFATCAMTALYYECKESSLLTSTEYIGIPTEEAKA